MSELLVMAWFHLVGFVFAKSGLRLPNFFASAAGFAVGAAAYVTLGSLLLLVGQFQTGLAVVLLSGATLVLAVKRRDALPRGRALLVPAGMLVIVLATAALSEALRLGKLSFDSFQMVQMGSIVAQTGDLADLPDHLLLARPLFLPILHTIAEPLGRFYLHNFAPVFGVTALATLGWLTFAVLRTFTCSSRRAAWFACATVVATVSSYFVVFQFFYVNGHLMMGLFLAMYAVGLWLAARTEDMGWSLLTALVLYSAVLLRLESPIVLLLFLAPLLAASDLNSRAVWLHGGVYVVSVGVWFGLVIGSRGGGGEISSEASVPVMLTAAGAFAVALAIHRTSLAQWFLRRINGLALAGVIAGVAVTVILKPSHMRASAENLIENMWAAGNWGLTWIVLIPLLVAALLSRRWPDPLVFVPATAFIPLTYALSFGRKPYRVGWGDSGNRMLVHILPLVTVFVVVTAAMLITRRPALQSTSSAHTDVKTDSPRDTTPVVGGSGRPE